MEQNFDILAQSRANYYTKGSPVQFVRVELLKGDVTGEIAVCLSFKNIGAKPLAGLLIGFKCKDMQGNVVCEDQFRYEALTVGQGEVFGSDDAVYLSPSPVGSVEVDLVAGATVTSNAAVAAVNNALDPEAYPYEAPAEKEDSKTLEGADLYHGLGVVSTGRQGPGSDDQEVPVYSFNTVAVQALFDGEGKIVALNVDQVEVATPNYDGDGMPHFSGYPGKVGYNYDENNDAVVDRSFLEEIASWQTKRQRGDGYQLGSGTWTDEMNAFEQFFVGMTVDEVEAWFAASCSDSNGRPLKITDNSSDEDKAKFDALTPDEQTALADLTASATMSLRDAHGDILTALTKSCENARATA